MANNPTFVDYLLNENEAEMSAKMSAISAHIKSIVNNFLTSVGDDDEELNHRMLLGREVFDTMEDVANDRLSGEQVPLHKGSSKGGYDEWKDDKEQNYSRLWQSIEDEMRDSVEEVLMPANEDRDRRGAAQTAIRHFNNHIVGPFIDMLRQYKPEEAKHQVESIIDQMEHEWNNYSRMAHPDDAQVARQMLMKHQRERQKRMTAKRRRSQSKRQRAATRQAVIDQVGGGESEAT